MYTTMPRRVALALTALTFTLAAAACGSDDDGESSATTAGGTAPTTAAAAATTTEATETTEITETTEATETTEGSDTTAGGSGGAQDVDAFCAAEIEAEQAAQAEDPQEAGPAFEALVAAAPEEIKATVEDVVANAESGPGDPAFDEPYGEMISYMRENCGFNEIEVEGADYSFTGIPADIEAGPAIITFSNVGEELHEVSFARINDGVTESVEELLQLSEDEAFSRITPVGGGFAFPGTTSYAVVDLSEPGTYVASCFVPQGLTPEVAEEMEAMESEGTMPEGSMPEGSMPEGSMPEGSMPEGSMPGGPMAELGPPHAMLGMVQELTVT